MTPLPPSASLASTAQLLVDGGAELIQASMAILGELESSLLIGQKALLARDLAGVEQATREQIRLRRALEVLWARDVLHPRNSDPTSRSEPGCESPLATGLRAAQLRVLHLGRVQAALLARARRSLRMISNLLAGPEAIYGLPGDDGTAPNVARSGEGEERNPCRA